VTVRLRVGARTDVGRVREGNEDGFVASEPLFAVADGMGGHQGGEVASKVALETLQKAADGTADLAEVVQEANRAVFTRASQDPALLGMGTTLTAVLVEEHRLHLAHVGDSRMYLARDGRLERITRDHTVVEEMVEQGRLTPEEAAIHPQRSIVTRALGVEEDIQVDELDLDVRPGDRVLLCSDGLTGMVDEGEILRLLTEHRDAQAATDALVDAANRAGGQDNITAVILDVVGDDTGTAPQAAVTATVERPRARKPSGRRRRWGRVVASVAVVLILVGGALFVLKRFWVDRQWYVGESSGRVALYQGIPAAPLGVELSTVVEETELPAEEVTAFPEYADLASGITAESEADARAILDQMRTDVNEARREAREPQGP
jgi:serine/threonine protein phosphatase PrpC